MILPSDFMRLVAFRMSDWKRTIFDPIKETDPEYGKQSSKWKGICGSPEKPVVAIVHRSEGKVLEFFSCKDNPSVYVLHHRGFSNPSFHYQIFKMFMSKRFFIHHE